MITIKYKYKQFLYFILFFMFMLLVLKTCSTLKSNSLHAQVSVNDVQSIIIRAYDSRTANSEETKNIIKWFNSINNIQGNPEFAGSTDSASIQIILKSNEKISILYPGAHGKDFEIQRYNKKNKYISYWGKQPDIREILEKASGE